MSAHFSKTTRARYHRLSLLIAVLLISLSLLPRSEAGAPDPDEVLLIGRSGDKGVVTHRVSAEAYRKTLSTAFSSVHDSILPTLASNESRETPRSRWRLRSLGVGIGLSGTMGLGPLLAITAAAHLRLVFSNHLSPIYPD